MDKKYMIVIGLFMFLFCGNVQAQSLEGKTKTISSVLTDEKGSPIAGAIIYGNEGSVYSITDESGKFTITIESGSDILIECEGYDSQMFNKEFYEKNSAFTLRQESPFFGQTDMVNTGFGKVSKGSIANSVYSLDPKEILKYDNSADLLDMIRGNVPGMSGTNLRSMGTPAFIVDGLPRDYALISVSEIDNIVVLKDVNSAMLYGNLPLNGAVVVTTKRGKSLKKEVNVWGHYGLSTPRALPEYLSSADFMEQYNIARVNDGLPILYSDKTIDNYRNGNPYRYPSVDYYSGEYLRDYKPSSRVMMDISGGNKVATYYSNMSWVNEGSLLDFGYGKTSRNKFTARGNVDLKINSWINSSIDAAGFIDNDKDPNSSFWSGAATYRPDVFSPLIPIDLIDPENELLKASKNHINDKYLAGGNSTYNTNPITDTYLAGDGTVVWRNFSFSNRIDFDLSSVVDGLGFHTNFAFDFLNIYREYVYNNYATYAATWDENDKITGLVKFGEDNRTGVQQISDGYGQRRFGFYGMLDYYRTFNSVHHISANLLGYFSQYKISYDTQATKNANLGFRFTYNYANKYVADFNSALPVSSKLHPDNRVGFSPSLGLAWIISSEGFMSSIDFVSFLKLKISGGIMNTDVGITDYFLYDDRYSGTGGFSWYEGSRGRSGTAPSFGANKNLFFEKRKDFNIGLEGELFNRLLGFDLIYFNNVRSDIITRPNTQYPSYFTSYIPYENYNKYAYRGVELGLSIRKRIGNFGFVIGTNLMYADSEVLQMDEIYGNDYQYRKGNPVSASYGLVSDGFFMSQDEIDGHAIQAFGAVQPGDIKYVDLNKDGIVNDNDQKMIGKGWNPFSCSINLKLTYMRFTLYVRGSGSSGGTGYLGNSNYYFVQGDVKYSKFMLNHWTEETKHTATYPRLSTKADNNNFRGSDFWLYSSDRFNLDRIQLTYSVPVKSENLIKLKALSVFANASSILTIAKNKDYMILNIGSEPQYRTFTVGLTASF